MRKAVLFISIFFVVMATVYWLGSIPTTDYPAIDFDISQLDIPIKELDTFIDQKEAAIPNLKPDNNATIVWADSIRRTPYSIVYLHGFSASRVEGRPVHRDFAARYGCNMYLARLADHGQEDIESFKEITPADWIDSAKEAIAIGQLLGEKVIVMSCSTGSTLSAVLAATNPGAIYAQIMYSPNFALKAAGASLMTGPWGLELTRTLIGSDYRKLGLPEDCYPYWTTKYRIEGVVALQALIDETIQPELLAPTSTPVFIGYYYKNEKECDDAVSIPAMHEYFNFINTPTDQKVIKAFPDVGSHVMVSDLQSKDIPAVQEATYQFVEDVLGLKPRF